jgi:hypothetical protein
MARKKKSSSVSDAILGKDFKNPFVTSDKPKRDSKRTFTETQKKKILHKQKLQMRRIS